MTPSCIWRIKFVQVQEYFIAQLCNKDVHSHTNKQHLNMTISVLMVAIRFPVLCDMRAYKLASSLPQPNTLHYRDIFHTGGMR